jgi:hypothetical protein
VQALAGEKRAKMLGERVTAWGEGATGHVKHCKVKRRKLFKDL